MNAAVGRGLADGNPILGMRLFVRMSITPRWLARTVVPVVRALGGQHTGLLYLRRGWLHGPHVDIVAQPVPGLDPVAWDEVAERVDLGPVTEKEAMSGATYLDQAREFGRLEGVSPPYLPMRAHGTVEFLHADEVEKWPQPLQGLRDMALDQMTVPLMATLEALNREPQKATVHVAEAFAAIAASHRAGAGQGVFSLRSHAEAFFAWASPRKDPRPAFKKRLASDSAQLRPVVERALSGEMNGLSAQWARSFAYCMGAFDQAVLTGQLTQDHVDNLGGGFDTERMGPPGSDGRVTHQPSAFHQTMDSSGVTDSPNEWFASYRLLINLFYQQLPLLGVPPMHRYYLCHSVAELVDEVLGTSWHERIGLSTQGNR